MVSAGMNVIKYVLFAFNLLFCIFGIALMGIGIVVQIQLKVYLDFFNTDVNGPAILLIIVGLATLVIAFFGCCGAIKENHCMTLTFAVLIGLVFICEFSAGIAGYAYKAQVNSFVSEEMKDSMQNYIGPHHEGVQKTWDTLQRAGSCCGTSGPEDWRIYLDVNLTLPSTCCVNTTQCYLPKNKLSTTPSTALTTKINLTNTTTSKTTTTTIQASTSSSTTTTTPTTTDASARRKREATAAQDPTYRHTGCLDKVKGFVDDKVGYFAGAAVALAIVEIIGIILAVVLFRAFRREHEIV